MKMFVCTTAVALSLILPLHAAPGDVQSPFGLRTTVVGGPGFSSSIRAFAEQPDGKIVAVGRATGDDFGIVRYNPDGSPDTSFSSDGKDTIHFTGAFSDARGVGVQSDGKIVVAGDRLISGTGSVVMVRYTADGSRDNAYGTAGLVTATGVIGIGSALIQPDDRMLLLGYTGPDWSANSMTILRFNMNGSADTAFNNNTGRFTANNVLPRTMTLMGDGRILAAGLSPSGANTLSLIRLHSNGTPDLTLGGFGSVSLPLPSGSVQLQALGVLSDGRIVAAVSSCVHSTGTMSITVARWFSDGSPDTTLGASGAVTSVLTGLDSPGCGLIRADGSVVLGGSARRSPASSEFAVVGLTAGALADPDFNGSGVPWVGFGTNSAAGTILPLSNGRSMMIGGSSEGRFAAARMSIDNATPEIAVEYPQGTDRPGQSQVDLEPVVIGSFRDYTFTLRNTGIAPLTISPSPFANNTFSFSTPPPSQVPGGSSGSFTVRFTPTAIGHHSAELKLTTNDPGEELFLLNLRTTATAPNTINLLGPSGTGVSRGGTVDFGRNVAGSNTPFTFTVRNDGAATLSQIAVSATAQGGGSPITVVQPAVNSLAPGASTTFTVNFNPAVDTSHTGELSLTGSAPGESPFLVNLTGSGSTILEAWRFQHFGSFADSGPGADTADTDLDGLINLVEFGLLTNPIAGGAPPITVTMQSSNLNYIITRPVNAPAELTYTLEVAGSLTGPWIEFTSPPQVLSSDGTAETVKFTAPATARRVFARLRIARRP